VGCGEVGTPLTGDGSAKRTRPPLQKKNEFLTGNVVFCEF